jgi:hypothetical protein
MTMPENERGTENREQALRDFNRILNQQADIGLTKIISSWFFHRPNIFDPNSRRRPKPEILIVLGYLLLMAAVCGAFNFR